MCVYLTLNAKAKQEVLAAAREILGEKLNGDTTRIGKAYTPAGDVAVAVLFGKMDSDDPRVLALKDAGFVLDLAFKAYPGATGSGMSCDGAFISVDVFRKLKQARVNAPLDSGIKLE